MQLEILRCICLQAMQSDFEFYDATASYLFYTGTGTDFERAGVATSKLGDHPAE